MGVGTMICEKLRKSVKYTVRGLDCLFRAANAMSVTYNMDVH